MRKRVLQRSIERRLPEGEAVVRAASMWTFHPRALVIAAASMGIPILVLSLTEASWSQRFVWAVLITVAVTSATTRTRILAQTTSGLVLLRSSPVRQAATGILQRWDDGPSIEKLGGNLATSEWRIDGTTYTVSKRAEKELEEFDVGHHRRR